MASTYVTFRDFYSAGSSIYFRSDSDNPDPINGINISGSKVDVKNIIRVGKGSMPACRRPYGLTAYNVASNQATINWDHDNVSGVSLWDISLNGAVTRLSNGDKPYQLTGLTQHTTYTIKVRAIKMYYNNLNEISTDISNWSAPYTFTTPDACPAPTDLLASNIKSTSAKLSWTSSASSWKLAYKTYDADNYTEIDVTNPYTLTGLHPTVDYVFKVKAICGGNDGESNWSNEYSFYAAEQCPDETVCIGTGNSSNANLPYNTTYDYSFSEQIYTAEELGLTGTVNITSVQLYNPYFTDTRQISIYMIHTTNSTFNNSFFPALSGDRVFEGTVTFEPGVWTTINFDIPFSYNGTQNICLAISASSDDARFFGAQFLVFDSPSQSIYIVGNNNPVFNPETGYASGQGIKANVKNRVRFGYESASCSRPTNLTVNYNGENDNDIANATITWDNPVQNANYILDINGTTESVNINSTTTINLGYTTITVRGTGTSFILSDLELATTYTVRLKRDCGNGDFSNWSNTASFTTVSCFASDQCRICFELSDTYGDSWDGANIEVIDIDEGRSLGTVTRTNSDNSIVVMSICHGHEIQFVWNSGRYDNECIYDVYYWQSNVDHNTSHGETIFEGQGAMDEPIYHTVNCAPRPGGLTATNITENSATLDWHGSYENFNLRYRHPVQSGEMATIILNYPEDIWGDNSGYQILLDPTATAYDNSGYADAGNFNPTADIYSAFAYKLPENADYNLNTTNIVAPGESATIQIPAGIYDYFIVNPSPTYNNTYIVHNNSNFPGHANNYPFEAGKTYIITITGNNYEIVNLTHPMGEWTVVENIHYDQIPYNIGNLTSNTQYEWQVQGIDQGNDPSKDGNNTPSWSDIANFTTALFSVPFGKWQAISTPVHDNNYQYVSIDNVSGLTGPDYDLFRYNESSGTWENQKDDEDNNVEGFNTLDIGRGYIYRCSTKRSLYFNGVNNFGDYSIDLTADGSGDLDGFNLIGNPYPYSVTVNRAFYSLNADGTWQLHSDGGDIDVAQGILVYTDNHNGETITFYASTHSTSSGSKGSLPPLPAALCLSVNCDDATHYPSPSTSIALLVGDHLVITATGTLQAYDILGRLLFSKEITTPNSTISTLSFPASGVYILRLGDQTQKIVIR